MVDDLVVRPKILDVCLLSTTTQREVLPEEYRPERSSRVCGLVWSLSGLSGRGGDTHLLANPDHGTSGDLPSGPNFARTTSAISLPYLPPRSLGSSTSRRASPKTEKAKVTIVRAIPG